MAESMLHGLCFGEEAGARNLVFFRVKVAAGDDERYLVCATGAAAVVPDAIGSFYVFCNKWLFLWCSSMRSWSCGCKSHCNGCMHVAWSMFWGGSRSTKPCVFPCKVAAGDDERYLVCATVAAAVVPDAIGSFYVFCNKWLFLWCSSMRSWSCGCRSHCNGCMNVAWSMFWGGSRSTTPCVLNVARCRGCMRNTIVFCSWTS